VARWLAIAEKTPKIGMISLHLIQNCMVYMLPDVINGQRDSCGHLSARDLA
jgi:hypothetical protein